MNKTMINIAIRWISELPDLRIAVEKAETRYFETVEKILSALAQKYGKNEDGVYVLPYRYHMTTTSIQNDGMSGSEGSEWIWELEDICYYPEQKSVSLFCEGYEFDVCDFDMDCLHDLCHEIDVTDGKGPEDDDENKDEKDDKEK